MKKSKILKIALPVIIILLIIFSAVKVNSAAQTIYGKTFTNNGGTYNNAFQDKGEQLFNITWNQVKDNYYTAGSTNDYKDFIKGSNDGYCLNEKKADGNLNFYVAAIIDIEGKEAKIYSRNQPNGQIVNIGKIGPEFATVVYYKYTYPNGKELDYENEGSKEATNAYWGETWVQHYGWHELYTKVNNYIGDTSIQPTGNRWSYYDSYFENHPDSTIKNNLNSYDLSTLSIVKNGNLTLENGSYYIDDNKEVEYKTKLGKYNITKNSQLGITIKVIDEKGNEYEAIYHTDGYIYTREEIKEQITSVKVTQSYNGYKARLIMIGTGDKQARMVAYAKRTTISKTAETTDVPPQQTDVSLQKYIVKVTGKNVSTDIEGRENTKTFSGDANTVKNDIYFNFINDTKVTAGNNYKKVDPVQIEVGDEVTYRIYVYNNSTVDAANITVKDRLPYYYLPSDNKSWENNGNKVNAASLVEIKYKDKDNKEQKLVYKSNEEIQNGHILQNGEYTSTVNTDNGCTELSWETSLAAKSSTYFDVTLKFNKYLDGIIENRAWINKTTPNNKGEYRIEDADYVKMKKYAVSLEKYVTEVTDANGQNSYNNRVGYRYNEGADQRVISIDELGEEFKEFLRSRGITDFNSEMAIKDLSVGIQAKLLETLNTLLNIPLGTVVNSIQDHNIYAITGDKDKVTYSLYKNNNKVSVEAGDIVTYTIRLKNTGEAPVKVTQIYDSFTVIEDNGEDNGLKLIYVEKDGIQGNGGGTIVDNDNHYLEPDNSDKTLDKYLIQFNDDNATLIQPGESEYVTIKFQVEVPINLTTKVCTLQNKAGVVELTNNNGDVVADSDGEDNNHDMDWIQTKTYAVSLEKYVSKVVDKDGNIEEYDYREGKAQHKYDNDANTDSNEKYNKPVSVSNGDTVTYTIKVTNDGDTRVKITNVADYIPDGVEYNGTSYTEGHYCKVFEHKESESDNGQTNNKIEFSNTIELQPGESKAFEVVVKVIEPNVSLNLLKNVAEITAMTNRNDVSVLDTTGNNNKDADYIQLDWDSTPTNIIVEKKWEDNNNQLNKRPTSIKVQLYRNNSKYGKETTLTAENNWKYVWEGLAKYDRDGNEYVYTVREEKVPEGYKATHVISGNKITITNTYVETPPVPETEKTSITVTKQWKYDSEDVRPDSITAKLYQNENVLYQFELSSSNQWQCHFNLDKYDSKGNEYIYTVQEINVPEDYRVEYEIIDSEIIIINKYDAPNSPDVIIGGYVWNDIALDKTQNNYNSLLDNEEKMLEGIKVYLYRLDEQNSSKIIATKTTNSNGYYSFSNIDIETTAVEQVHERYIKGPKAIDSDTNESTQRWAGTYYSYYVQFEYDGVIYTSTPDGTSWEDIIKPSKDDENYYKIDSNANEDDEGRSNFNSLFDVINNKREISYITKNENGYIPQSNYNSYGRYGANLTYSNTGIINFEDLLGTLDYSNEDDRKKVESIEDKIKYVGLGLRGRDIFDLELTSDVDNIKVTVNNQQGVYKYSNKVNLRQQDLTAKSNIDEDMANKTSEVSHTYVDGINTGNNVTDNEGQQQKIRNTDYNVDTNRYDASQGVQGIEVTYKITVQNTSNTDGTATKITNYYDDAYTFVKAYDSQNKELNTSKDVSGTGYKSVIVTTPGTNLSQSEIMEIYVVYSLDLSALEGLKLDNPIPTYNMAEITEYTTQCAKGQTEYIRGLIDKDSAPGSANREQVRLTTTEGVSTPTTGGNPTTVDYYFGGNDLSVLKYEDDTYATPTLYFVVADENTRTITGTVFRDETITDATTKIKTGNGKLDEGEAPVFGATVELIELVEGNQVRFKTTTDKDGKFEFKGFLPGNYIIKYYYGDTENTVLKEKDGVEINKYSFNGEDYQSTNNSETIDGMDTNILKYNDLTAEQKAFWYVYNEEQGISTAKDDSDRRKTVTANVLSDSNNIMTLLNNIRDSKTINETDINSLTEKTHMYADTQEMLFTVEETIDLNKMDNKDKDYLLEKNLVTIRNVDTDVLLAEWAIFPSKEEGALYQEYKIENMNFGIAEVPVTTIDLQKEVQGFTITDSTGQNILAKAQRADDGMMKVEVGNIITQSLYAEGANGYSSQIEDEKLQGSRLQITYRINSNIDTEVNYDKKGVDTATIKEFVDIIDNNLSYNASLGDNSKYWVVRKEQLKQEQTSIKNIANYSTIVNATDIALNELNKGETITITLEKILSSTNSTIEEIITSTVDVYEYNNTVEILELSYKNVSNNDETPQKDRIRISDRYIIIPGSQHDTASAETITITPPTGNGSMDITYYVIAGISLMVLAAGVFGIKKFVVNTKK